MEKNSTLFYTANTFPPTVRDREGNTSPDATPSDDVIQNVLNFSKALRVAKINSSSKVADVSSVEMILN